MSEQKSEKVTIRMESVLYDVLRAHAFAQRRSLVDMMRIALEEWIASQPPVEPLPPDSSLASRLGEIYLKPIPTVSGPMVPGGGAVTMTDEKGEKET